MKRQFIKEYEYLLRLKDIRRQLEKEYKELEERFTEDKKRMKNGKTFKEYLNSVKNGPYKSTYDYYRDALKDKKEEIKESNGLCNIQKHNVLVTMYYISVAALEECLPKYNGKPAGPKTRNKLYDEFYKLTGFNMSYINSYGINKYGATSTHANKIIVNMRNNKNTMNVLSIEIGSTAYDLLPNNKFDISILDNINLWYHDETIINDIESYYKESKKAYDKVLELQNKLAAATTIYNGYKVEGFPDVKHIIPDYDHF